MHFFAVIEFLPAELKSRLLQVRELDEQVQGKSNTYMYMYMYVHGHALQCQLQYIVLL